MKVKSKGVAYGLHIFLGMFGAGRFYIGDIGMGILNLLTFGGFGVLWFIDLFLLSGRVDFKNAMFMAQRGAVVNATSKASANSNNVNNNTVNVTIDAASLQQAFSANPNPATAPTSTVPTTPTASMNNEPVPTPVKETV